MLQGRRVSSPDSVVASLRSVASSGDSQTAWAAGKAASFSKELSMLRLRTMHAMKVFERYLASHLQEGHVISMSASPEQMIESTLNADVIHHSSKNAELHEHISDNNAMTHETLE